MLVSTFLHHMSMEISDLLVHDGMLTVSLKVLSLDMLVVVDWSSELIFLLIVYTLTVHSLIGA